MNTYPLISVIMPVYNGANTIRLALTSLLNQTYSNWKCVIVNDGSNDGTKEILNTIKDERFVIIHLDKNVGRGAARQIALDNSEGEFLAYLDADDFYHSEKLRYQVNVLINDMDIALVGCRILTFNSTYQPISRRGVYTKKEKYNFGDNLYLVMPTSMIRLSQAKNFRYDSKMNASEDLDYFSRYLDGKYYSNLDDILVYYSITEATNYWKVLDYTKFEIKRGIKIFHQNRGASVKVIIKASVKWGIYATLIPILGINFFLNRRGLKANQSEITEFESQLKHNISETTF